MDDQDYMDAALAEARKAGQQGEVPIGAVVVYAPIDRATHDYGSDRDFSLLTGFARFSKHCISAFAGLFMCSICCDLGKRGIMAG